jgi:hypothetical protein
MSATTSWAQRARDLEVELRAVYLAYRDPRVPWYAKAVAACVVGYAFSPGTTVVIVTVWLIAVAGAHSGQVIRGALLTSLALG